MWANCGRIQGRSSFETTIPEKSASFDERTFVKSLSDWLAHLENLHPKGQAGIELGLDRVSLVKTALQQRQACPLIIIGGTNGKGSTCAYLEAIYSLSLIHI